MISWKKFFISLAICHGTGIAGAMFTASAISTWYEGIIKPSFSPPNWIFGPVWTTLYTLMAISLYFVWVSHSNFKRVALISFFTQLILNAIWSPIFFGLRSPLIAFVVILLLLVAIVLTTYVFSKASKAASALLLPYIAWVSFATVLNYSIWRLN